MNAFPAHTHNGDRPLQVFNVRYLPRWRRTDTEAVTGEQERSRDVAGGMLLAVASVLLLVLAAAQGYVSYRAQYSFVHAIKHESAASVLESLGLDCAAVIFALLALAQARLGRPALAERVLNLACVSGSLIMNALSADITSAKSIAVWTLPAALYAAASDRLIAVVRRRALAVREDGDEQEATSPLMALGGVALWLLRLILAPFTTCKGFRAWVLDTAPVAPGRHITALPAPARPALPAGTGTPTHTTADTTPGTVPDEQAASTADTPRPVKPARRAATTGRRGGRKSVRPADREADALALLTAEPDLSGAELGRRLKVSERTGRRLHTRVSGLLTPPASDTTTPAPSALVEGDAS